MKPYRDISENRNVIEQRKANFDKIKGKWNSIHFLNDFPITLELACGRGEYSVGLGRLFPERNFIGIDIKGARLWKGSTIAKEEGLENIAFLRAQIDHIEEFFETNEVHEMWIVFPDPQPRDSSESKRLTHPRFLEMYKNILVPGGIVHFKTDNQRLFDYSMNVINNRKDVQLLDSTTDLYKSDLFNDHNGIQTRYELKFLQEGFKINYLRFRFNDACQ